MGKGAEIYFIIHAILIITCVVPEIFSSKFGPKAKIWVMFFWSLFFTIFAGIRWQNGTDWYQYLYHFQYSNFDNIFGQSRDVGGQGNLEWLFLLLNAIVNKLTGEFWVYNTLTAGFIQFTQFFVIKKLCPSRPLLFYCLLMVNDASYFAVRSQLSTGVGLWCYYFYKQYCDYRCGHDVKLFSIRELKKYIRQSSLAQYFVSWYAAYSIHHQSIVLLPMFLAGKVKLNACVYIVLAVVLFGSAQFLQRYVIVFSSFLGGDVGEKALHYTEFVTTGAGEGRGIASMISFLLFAVVFLIVRKREGLAKEEWYNGMLNLYLVWCTIYIVFSGAMGDLVRLSYQFNFARLFLMVAAFECFYRSKYPIKKVLLWMVFLVYVINRWRQLDSWYYFYLANVPYKTILGL